ncbi:hypothetical protein SpCBS45565_g07979 [Spizellomyces sp. 'palustris']|nr:hypothetical protein SpCBS45565_g07979 [Spizellomyces sp. 'palustris']
MSFLNNIMKNIDKVPLDKIQGIVKEKFNVDLPLGNQQQQSSSSGQNQGGYPQQQGGYGAPQQGYAGGYGAPQPSGYPQQSGYGQPGGYSAQNTPGQSGGYSGGPPPNYGPIQGEEPGISGAPTFGYHHVPQGQPGHMQQQPLQVAPGAPQAQQWGTQTTGGKRRGLFIGINYFGQKGELKGCINDVQNVHKWLTSNYPFAEILVLTDDQQDPSRKPTRANLLNACRWLVEGVQPGDAFFLHYSGHGSQQKDTSGLEKDGFAETIVPVDYEAAGQITDDELHEILVRPLPKGSRLTAIFDCCHSGSILDLPFTYTVDGSLEVIVRDNRNEAIKAGIKAGLAFFKKDNATALREAKQVFSLLTQKPDDPAQQEQNVKQYGSDALVVQFSGCRDDQTSADASIGGEATGAMSWALLKTLNAHQHHMTYTQVLRDTRELLQGQYKQVPQMSTGHQMDVGNMLFSVI